MAFQLLDRTILVISPNEWGRMHVSKHHYALELARRGNTVYFLNPPRAELEEPVEVAPHPEVPGLHLVTYRPFFPLWIRFRLRPVFDALMRLQVRRLLGALGVGFDVVWSFETNLYSDLTWFRGGLTIYHPVDQVRDAHERRPAESADVLFSVSDEILSSFAGMDVPRFFVNHGVADVFIQEGRRLLGEDLPPFPPLRVGFVGNLLSNQLDREVFTRIVRENPAVEFHVWGPLRLEESNVAGVESPEVHEFVRFLESRANVVVRGVVPPGRLVREIPAMHAFLFCSDRRKDPYKGSNSHKILEYLSTGRVVVSSHLSAYERHPGLMEMLHDDSNAGLPELFADSMRGIAELDRPELRRRRIEFALAHSYARQIGRIEERIGTLSRG